MSSPERYLSMQGANRALLSNLPSLEALRTEKARRLGRTLHGFMQLFWPVVEGIKPFIDNWHLGLITEHLEACINREIKRLIINMPPRCAKSTLASVMLCPFAWGPSNHPHERFLYASYASTLSARDSRMSRLIIRSKIYQELYGDIFTIEKTDKDTELLFRNSEAGQRLAVGVGGSGTGFGGSFIVWDDLLRSDDAQSDAVRESTLDWYTSVLSTRLDNPKQDVEIGIMQRLHQRDPAGYVLSEIGGYEHLCLPMEWDSKKRTTILKPDGYDPRTKEGELLWPARYSQKEVDILRVKLGQYGFSGQMQQDPSPPDGGILKTSALRLWPEDKALPVFSMVLQSIDTAFTVRTFSDYSAMVVFGVFEHKGRMNAMIIDAWHERFEFPELRERLKKEVKTVYGDPKGGQRAADAILIEPKGSGISLIQDLQRAGVPTQYYKRGVLDKMQRANLIAPLLDAKLLWVPESSKDEGEPVTWVRWLMDEMRRFPHDAHDDGVDAVTQAMIYLHDAGWLNIDIREEVNEVDYSRKRNVNPYSN